MSYFAQRRVSLAIALVLALSVVIPVAAYHDGETEHNFADGAFVGVWARTDQPVATGDVDRTWMWGPEPYTEGMNETYVDSPGGERLVQYFDKSRMEINDFNADPNDLWYVTNGLLVVEMVDGRFQIGDDEFDDTPAPAELQIAGDPNASFGPTYADINRLGLRQAQALDEFTTITQTIQDGQIVTDEGYAGYGVTAEHRVQVPGIDHTVASVFWDFMNSEGVVFEDDPQTGGQLITDDLFVNPFYATGYPITEAYWTTVPVEGVETDVLWQCFERRCLTYTPSNDPGWQVEAGNVGQHYYQWRYGAQEPQTETVLLPLVAIDDPDAGQVPFGCNDSLVGVPTEIQQQDTLEQRITAALEELFVLEHDELYNVFTAGDTDIYVESVTVIGSTATINVGGEILPVGGVCDEPRVEEQIRHTALQFEGITDAVVLYQGGPLFEPQQVPDEGIVAIFDVNGEQFRAWVTNQDTIDQIYALQAGESMANIPNGAIHRGSGDFDHNNPWSWHLDPEDIEMAEVTTEVCDGAPTFVEDEVDYFVDDVGRYCPWNAELVEVRDYQN